MNKEVIEIAKQIHKANSNFAQGNYCYKRYNGLDISHLEYLQAEMLYVAGYRKVETHITEDMIINVDDDLQTQLNKMTKERNYWRGIDKEARQKGIADFVAEERKDYENAIKQMATIMLESPDDLCKYCANNAKCLALYEQDENYTAGRSCTIVGL